MERNRKRRSTLQPGWPSGPVAATVTAGVWLAMPAWADPSFFSTATPDALRGAPSQPPASGKLETETADDFILTETTGIAQPTITGLILSGTLLVNISNVEIGLYHVFPADSNPPSGNVDAFKAFCEQRLSRHGEQMWASKNPGDFTPELILAKACWLQRSRTEE